MGARNRVGTGLSYRPARLCSLAESLESILGLLKSLEIRAQLFMTTVSVRYVIKVVIRCLYIVTYLAAIKHCKLVLQSFQYLRTMYIVHCTDDVTPWHDWWLITLV
jgi:hypothetical protein